MKQETKKEKPKERKGLLARIKERAGRKKEEQKEEPEEIEKPKPTEPEEKPTGIMAQLKEIKENMETLTQETKTTKKLKKKKFKLPFKVKSQLKKLAKKNKVQVMLLRNNRNIKPTIGEIKDGMLLVEDKIYNGASDFIWLWNGKFPTVVLPEWDLNPLSASQLLGDAIENKRLADPQAIMIRAMEFKEAMQPKKIGGKTIIYLLIGGVIVFYVLFAGGT